MFSLIGKMMVAGFALVVLIAVLGVISPETISDKPSAAPADSTTAKPAPDPAPTEPTKMSDRDVVYVARYVIRKIVRDPDFETWPHESYGVSELGDNEYAASGVVTGKNAFNATVVNDWYVELKTEWNAAKGSHDITPTKVVLDGEQYLP